MANVMLLDGAFVPHNYDNVSSITLPTPDSGTVTFYASASASIDYGVETGSSLNAVYFNTRHDTTALDDYLEGASYPCIYSSLGIDLPFNILISDSNNNPLVFIASLPEALNSAYIVYAMNGQTPVVFYSTAAFDASSLIPDFAVPQGWQMDYASLGVTVTIGAIENNFVAIKDNYIARSAEAYGAWTLNSDIQSSKSVTLGAAAPGDVTPDSGKEAMARVALSLDTTVIKAENIAKDVTILGITGTHEGGGGGGGGGANVYKSSVARTIVAFSSSHIGSAADVTTLSKSYTFTLPTGAKIAHIVANAGWGGVAKYGASVSSATVFTLQPSPLVVTDDYDQNGIKITVDESGAAPTISVVLTASDNIINTMLIGSGNYKVREGGIYTVIEVVVFYDL